MIPCHPIFMLPIASIIYVFPWEETERFWIWPSRFLPSLLPMEINPQSFSSKYNWWLDNNPTRTKSLSSRLYYSDGCGENCFMLDIFIRPPWNCQAHWAETLSLPFPHNNLPLIAACPSGQGSFAHLQHWWAGRIANLTLGVTHDPHNLRSEYWRPSLGASKVHM